MSSLNVEYAYDGISGYIESRDYEDEFYKDDNGSYRHGDKRGEECVLLDKNNMRKIHLLFYFLKSIKDRGLGECYASYPIVDLDLPPLKGDNPLGKDNVDLLEFLRSPASDCPCSGSNDCAPLYDTPPLFDEDPYELLDLYDNSNCNSFDAYVGRCQNGDYYVVEEGDMHVKCSTSSLECPSHDGVLDIVEISSDLESEDSWDEVDLCDTFLYHLFAHDGTHTSVEGISCVDRNFIGVNAYFLDSSLRMRFPFDPGDDLSSNDHGHKGKTLSLDDFDDFFNLFVELCQGRSHEEDHQWSKPSWPPIWFDALHLHLPKDGITTFEMDYGHWVEEQDRKTDDLRSALNSQIGEIELRILVEGCLNHYFDLFRLKATAANTDVLYLMSGIWKTSAERFFLWIGGFRPSELLKVLTPHVEPLTEQQVQEVCNLTQSCQQAEDALSQGMVKLHQILAEAVAAGTLGDGNILPQMAATIEKLEALVRFVNQADHLRQETLLQMSCILTVHQSAQGLLALGEYFKHLRALSSLWDGRPSEPA